MQKVFPASSEELHADHQWAPVLAWLALQALPKQLFGAASFDELLLRPALAEAFSSVGLKGEDAWRAAARIRLLLQCRELGEPLAAVRTEEFWTDPDVRWLTGLHEHDGSTYFNREQFDEVLCWLHLPSLLADVTGALSSAEVEHAAKAAAKAGYTLETFLVLVRSEPAQEEADLVADAVEAIPMPDRGAVFDPIEAETEPVSGR